MSWFSRLFERKPGGTAVGNFIRRVANSESYGLLGNGDGLNRWEAENGYQPTHFGWSNNK